MTSLLVKLWLIPIRLWSTRQALQHDLASVQDVHDKVTIRVVSPCFLHASHAPISWKNCWKLQLHANGTAPSSTVA